MTARTFLVIAVVAGCAHAGGGGAPVAPANATEAYVGRLIAGDRAGIAAAFSGAPSIDDPFAGAVRGDVALDAFVAERHAWLAARAARLSPGPTTRAAGRTVVEAVLR